MPKSEQKAYTIPMMVADVAYDFDMPASKVLRMVQRLRDHIQDNLAAGNEVMLSGVGTFKVKLRKARKGRNPKTGELVDVPEHKKVAFVPSPIMKTKLSK